MEPLEEAKQRLDLIVRKSRTDMYKPIQIAEVLRRSRLDSSIDISNLESYRSKSKNWRDDVTRQLLGKKSTSSAKYQDDIWNNNAMPPTLLKVLDVENKKYSGIVERYIYTLYAERQSNIGEIISVVNTGRESFRLENILKLFEAEPGLRRSIDKAYEIVTYSLFETIITSLEATVKVQVPEKHKQLLKEFSDLAIVLLGLSEDKITQEQPAHIYRVGVTNAADRGLDMWANFGPAIQVKHLTLKEELAREIVDQVESQHIVVVCKQADQKVIQAILAQISWGKRVRGIVTEVHLIEWYKRCLNGQFAPVLATPLLQRLSESFIAEFPQIKGMSHFFKERGYTFPPKNSFWLTEKEKLN